MNRNWVVERSKEERTRKVRGNLEFLRGRWPGRNTQQKSE